MFDRLRWTLVIAIIFSLQLSSAHRQEDVSAIIADVNSKGYPDAILYKAAGFDGREKVDKLELIKRLENSEIQKSLMKAALNYASQYLNDAQKRELNRTIKKQSKKDQKSCSNSWLQWLPFLDCHYLDNDDVGNNSDKSELIAYNNFDVIKERSATCYKNKPRLI